MTSRSSVINFPGHHWHRCATTCNGCMFCHGGLAACTRCGGGEGSLPTDCPGVRMSADDADLVYAGVLDHRRGRGWVRDEPSRNSPAAYKGETL